MQPNILYIFSDQHRFCDVGYAGNHEVETPYLDALAEQGAWFSASYSNCPLCVPARGTILTGLHPLKHGAAANDLPVHTNIPSIANVLNGAGYETGYIGKWHLGGVPRDKFILESGRLGFSHWNGCNCSHAYMNAYYDDNSNTRHKIEGYEPFTQTELAIRYMEDRNNKDKPWALWLSYGTPHDPYDELPQEELKYWRDKRLNLRPNVEPDHLDPMEFIYRPKPDIRENYAGYNGHIRLLDRQIGRLVEWLRTNNALNNTVIVYTSDHGDMMGSHGFLNKQLYFEESAKIPLVISWPGYIPAGQRRQPISLVDHVPTLLGLLGLSGLENVDGTDQSAILRTPNAPGQQAVYIYSYVPCHQASLRTPASWRAIVSEKTKYVTDQDSQPVALYDLENDPYEMLNLMDNPAYVMLKKQMEKMLAEQVNQHDGYKPWQDLLKIHGLWQAWEDSEAHFRNEWAQYFVESVNDKT
jgi:arylsulfatase A-like enzyme